MITKSATIYDASYAARFDIDAAASKVHALIQAHKRTAGNTLLDVACGTGAIWRDCNGPMPSRGWTLIPPCWRWHARSCQAFPIPSGRSG
jgi:ubiquinone/menaquinone biosynthesis C-methylase UbiE